MSNFFLKNFSDSKNACLMAKSFDEFLLEIFLGLKNQLFAP